MSIFKAFFSLGKIPRVVKFFEFQSFDDVNKMGGAIQALKEQAKVSGAQLTGAQKKYLDDQMKQVEMVFEQIQQPSTQSGIRSTKSAKVFDLQGNKLDPNKPIMGGTQKIDEAIDNASPGFASGDRKYNAQLVADDLAEKRFGKDFYDLDQRQQMQLYDEAYQGLSKLEKEIADRLGKENKMSAGRLRKKKMREEISKVNDQIEEMIESGVDEMDPKLGKLYDKQNDLELRLDFEDMMNPDPDGMAEGGRIGLKAGMTKRAFLKLMGAAGAGIGAAKTGLITLGKNIEPVAETVKETVTKAPEYFFALMDKIRRFGKSVDDVTADPRVERTYVYKDYELKENAFGEPGEMIITKKTDMGPNGYKEESMRYKKGGATEDGMVADEYEELTVRPDREGKLKDVEEGIDDASEIIKEATGDAPPIKKAGGGIARMLGE